MFRHRALAPPPRCLFEAGLAFGALAWSVLHDRRRRRTHHVELTAARRLSRTDPLTGLPNRTVVQERMDRQPDSGVAMVALLDLDGFKQVNDTYGHDIGDELLVRIAARLTQTVADAGVGVARLAGDEFVLLWNSAASDPVAHVEHLLHLVAGPVDVAGARVDLAISVGIALTGVHLQGAGLLRAADAAMYQAKTDPKRAERPVRVRLWTCPHPPPRTDRRSVRDHPNPCLPTEGPR